MTTSRITSRTATRGNVWRGLFCSLHVSRCHPSKCGGGALEDGVPQ